MRIVVVAESNAETTLKIIYFFKNKKKLPFLIVLLFQNKIYCRTQVKCSLTRNDGRKKTKRFIIIVLK